MVGLANRAESFRTAYLLRDFSIRAGRAVGNTEQGIPTLFLEFCAYQIKLAGEVAQFTAKVGAELVFIRAQFFRRLDPDFAFFLREHAALIKMHIPQSLVGGGDQQLAFRRLHTGEIYSFYSRHILLLSRATSSQPRDYGFFAASGWIWSTEMNSVG